jgi:2'-5' RNA ligase
METKRIFLASFVSENLFNRHFQNIKDIFAESCSGKWAELNNLHFTYKFLGNVPVENIPEIITLLKDKLVEYPFVLKFNGLGILKSYKNPLVLFARVYSPEKDVITNFLDIEKRLVKYGFPKEKQKFNAHITLLRIKNHNEKFEDKYELHKDLYIGKQQNYRINLVSSTLTQDGPIYEILA